LAAKPRSLPCSAGVRFLSAVNGGASTEELDDDTGRPAHPTGGLHAMSWADGFRRPHHGRVDGEGPSPAGLGELRAARVTFGPGPLPRATAAPRETSAEPG
ncbi:hypothetical protein ABT273_17010, partial [Streptomyces humidus]